MDWLMMTQGFIQGCLNPSCLCLLQACKRAEIAWYHLEAFSPRVWSSCKSLLCWDAWVRPLSYQTGNFSRAGKLSWAILAAITNKYQYFSSLTLSHLLFETGTRMVGVSHYILDEWKDEQRNGKKVSLGKKRSFWNFAPLEEERFPQQIPWTQRGGWEWV